MSRIKAVQNVIRMMFLKGRETPDFANLVSVDIIVFLSYSIRYSIDQAMQVDDVLEQSSENPDVLNLQENNSCLDMQRRA